jgi:hypothetical protein
MRAVRLAGASFSVPEICDVIRLVGRRKPSPADHAVAVALLAWARGPAERADGTAAARVVRIRREHEVLAHALRLTEGRAVRTVAVARVVTRGAVWQLANIAKVLVARRASVRRGRDMVARMTMVVSHPASARRVGAGLGGCIDIRFRGGRLCVV